MKNIKPEFISYNGDYPTLCFGNLKFKLNEVVYEIGGLLISGGSVCFDDDWNDYIEIGEWSIDESLLPEEIKKYSKEILDMVNSNINHGCCGGCI